MFRRMIAVGLALAVGCFTGAAAEDEVSLPLERMTLKLGGGVTLELVKIPAGTFMMGSPTGSGSVDEAQRRVTISKPFYMGIHQVTQAQYQAVMGSNPSTFRDREDSALRPVENVAWDDAVEFCEKLENLSEMTGRKVRLPTEAEWEYACRAGTTTAYAFGDALTEELANFTMVPHGGTGTMPVGSFPENTWGLFDMHGNVWEWCADWYGPYPMGAATDPKGVLRGKYRVLRGGSWDDYSLICRSANRGMSGPGLWSNLVGFRIALDAVE